MVSGFQAMPLVNCYHLDDRWRHVDSVCSVVTASQALPKDEIETGFPGLAVNYLGAQVPLPL